MNRKAQMTIFAILILVIVMAIAFMIYMRSQSVARINQQNLQHSTDTLLATVPVKSFVENCMEKITDEGLAEMGMQGGRFFKTQVPETTSLLLNRNAIPFDGNNASFGIYATPGTAPDYPYPGSLTPDDQSGAFGRLSLLELCANQGANAYDLPGAPYTCVSYNLIGSTHSVQQYLERYIEEKTRACVNIDELSKLYGYAMRDSRVTAQVLFGDDDVRATIDYEIEITTVANDHSTKVVHYSIDRHLRIKRIYELAYFLVLADTNNIFFNATDPATIAALTRCPDEIRARYDQPCLREGMAVEQIHNVCPTCPGSEYADVIRITDNQSIAGGYPYVFQFAVKNRAPAIDRIDRSVSDDAPYYWYLRDRYGMTVTPFTLYGKASSSTCLDCNIIVKAGDILSIYPWGIDPDGDPLTYHYTGWHTDTPLLVGGTYEGGGDINRWEGSTQYVISGKDASILTTADDAGVHTLRLTLSDEGGLSDYQDIKIGIEP